MCDLCCLNILHVCIVITSTNLFIIIFNVEIACRYVYVHVFFNFSNGTDGPYCYNKRSKDHTPRAPEAF